MLLLTMFPAASKTTSSRRLTHAFGQSQQAGSILVDMSLDGASTTHEIKVLAFKEGISFAEQVERIRQLVRLMKGMAGFIDAEAFYNEMSDRWVLHLLWTLADEPYVVSATNADANAILARLTKSAQLIPVIT